MTAAAFLSFLQNLDVRISLDGERLLCNAPKGALTPELRAQIAERKPELIELLRSLRDDSRQSWSPILRRSRQEAPPPSFAQERMWFLEQMEGADGVYNIPVAVRLSGDLREDLLGESLNAIVARHETLRMSFGQKDGRVGVRIADRLRVLLPLVDLSHVPPATRDEEVECLRREEAAAAFNLSTGPLLRGKLIRLDRREHVLLLTLHHTVCDGWSLGVLLKELASLYESRLAGRSAALPELPVQYVDYALWQRERLAGEALEHLLVYWREKLSGELPVLSLLTDRPRPAVQTFQGASYRVALDKSLGRSVEVLAGRENATPFMVLLGAFASLLHRYSGQDEIMIGTPIAGRVRNELEPLIGLFVNTLPLRLNLAGNPDSQTLLGRVRETALEAFAHQEVPFEKLVESRQQPRDLSRSPLFQVMFILQNSPVPALRLGDLSLEVIPDSGRTAKFDLTLEIELREGEYVTCWNYNRDLFDAATIERMAEHYANLLRAITSSPERALSSLPIMAGDEERRVLADFNTTDRSYPLDKCLHELIEEQVRRTPDATALVYKNESLTYGELNERSDRLAGYLHNLGVGLESMVGICVERSIEMVVGLLGILKAGGAYVPLDPTYPRDRLAYMLADSSVSVLLTQKRLCERLPEHHARVVCLDEGTWVREQGADFPFRSSIVHPEPDNLAYMIYTSGSTGKPKGAMNTHHAIVNRLLWMQEEYGLTSSDRVLQKTPFSFDVSVWEFFWPLLTGATLVMSRPEGHKDSAYLLRTIQDQRVTTVHFVPSMLAVFLAEKNVGRCTSLKRVICSGEALSWELKEKFYASFRPADRQDAGPTKTGSGNGCELHNLYGPTEAAVDVTYWPCDADTFGRAIVPIGRPVANTRMYVLDRYLRPVPLGVPGELHIAGVQIGRGYWSRPELTAERFIPNPFSDSSGTRMYKTGDLARYLPDGSIEYLGRLDHQVKIRGFRIEPGEIESRLREHPGVREAAVVDRDAHGDKQLVAYLVPTAGVDLEVSELRGFLKDKLPEYMLPASFVVLQTLPLSPNGKLDRKALPAPGDSARLRPGREPVGPRTPVEARIHTIWSDVLSKDGLSVEDDFFEVGGHSLMATQVVSRVRDAFQVELPVRLLFESPTIAALAARIEQCGRDRAAASQPPMPAVDRNQPLPLSFAQERMWFLEQMEGAGGVYNIPIALKLVGDLRQEALTDALNAVVARHETLRMTFGQADAHTCVKIADVLHLHLPLVDLSPIPLARREAELARVRRDEAQAAFDLSVGPLIRVKLVRLDKAEHVLLLTMHHAISDGWSLGVLLKELASLYESGPAGRSAVLPELPVQYVDYARWQRQRLESGVWEAQLSYWRETLSGELPVLSLPTDRPRPAVQTFRGACHRTVLDKQLTESLEAFASRQDATPFMVLLGAFAVLLGRYTGQDDIVIGTPIAGRVRSELEPLIGLFVNTLALRVNLAGNPDGQTLLERVRETSLEAFAHQEVPFEKLVGSLQQPRDLSRSPLFQAMFILQNAPLPRLELGGLALSVMPEQGETAKFDLTLELERVDGEYTACCNYNRDLFDTATIERMASHYRNLLQAIVAKPAQRLSSLRMLNSKEEHDLLVGFNATSESYLPEKCVHELLEEQVRRTPNAVALRCENESLTYGELNERSDRLAGYLESLGIGLESMVGICVERSIEMVIGLLGVLKAGGAYVPLDPTYPRDRLAYMLADSSVSVLLTQKRLCDRLPEHHARVVCLDETTPWGRHATSQSAGPSGLRPQPDNLAYMIYTSGSTGTPKGAMTTHRSLFNYLSWCTSAYEVEAGSGSVLHSSLSFDLTVTSLFPPLLAGRTVHLLPERLGIEALSESFCAASNWSLVKITPPHLELLARQVPAEKASGRTRAFIIGGENLTSDHVAFWRRHSPQTVLINEYGPTETVVGCCIYAVPPGKDFSGVLPIGRPIANTQLYVLDASLNPVPVGVEGELYIGGHGVARGYWNRPEQTAERFIPDPFSAEPGSRLYRTGDRVRFLPDGNLECLGRLDHQVKIRGYRIELGEVEHALQQHPVIREAVVQVREGEPGQKRLIAYLVARDAAALDVDDVRQGLLRSLPEYMVPSAFVRLEAMPLTPNGKLDRKALPAPDGETRLRTNRRHVPPTTPAERALATVWSSMLRVSPISAGDNYFELGGDSILSIRMISQLRDHGFKLTARQVFQYPTLAEMAAVAEPVSVAECDHQPATGEVIPSPIQRWFFEQQLSEPHHWNQSVFLSAAGPITPAVLEPAMRAILSQHEMLRVRVNRDGHPWRLLIAPADGSVSIDRFDLSQMSPGQQDKAIETQAARLQAGLDLAGGPVARMAWFNRGPDRPAGLLIMIHHLAVDGVSWRILLEDLDTAVRQAQEGRTIRLPARTTSFQRWTQRLVDFAGSEDLRQEAAWWLAESAPLPPLPVDLDVGDNLESSVRVVTHTLDADTTTALLNEVPAAYHTRVSDVLLAALLQACSRWAGQPKLRLALEGHGREDLFEGVDLSRTVGWFTTLYPLTLQRSETDEPGQLLVAVKEQLRRVPRGGLGYGLLRYYGDGAPEMAALRNAREPELCFNYLGQFDSPAGASSPLQLSDQSTGPNLGPRNRRRFLIEINAAVARGVLRVDWRYSENRHRRGTIEKLAGDYMAGLRQVIDHCRAPEAGGHTPSDFPLAGMDDSELAKLSRLLNPGAL